MVIEKISVLIMKADELITKDLQGKYRLVSTDMGYGQQRVIYPLKDLSKDNIILNANTLADASPREKRLWKELLNTYEFMSRSSKTPTLQFNTYVTRLFA
jgi:hypothetical protein